MKDSLSRLRQFVTRDNTTRNKKQDSSTGGLLTNIASVSNPALDGIRGILVVLVGLYDTGVVALSGFFVWVDGFFVLSGYLITTLLIRELNVSGSISLTRFWKGRAKRILPSLLVVVFVYAIGEMLFGPSNIVGSVRGDALAAVFGLTNWYVYFTRLGLINHVQNYGMVHGQLVLKNLTFYKASDGNPGLLNIWILSVIEQFYLLWPIVVVLLYKWLKNYKFLFRISIFLAILSAARMFAAFNHGANFNGGYYTTDSRGQALMLGAALAFLLARFDKIPNAIRSLLDTVIPFVFIGTLLMAADAIQFSKWMFSGGFLVFDVAVCMIIAFTVLCPKSELMPIITHPIFRILGRISFGLFLWQYPVDVAVTQSFTGLSSVSLYIVRTIITFILGSVSYLFVEQPIIAGRYFRRIKPVKLGLIVAAVVMLLGVSMGVITSIRGESQSTPGNNSAYGGLISRDPIRILVIGDSMAYSLAVGLKSAEGQFGILVDNVAMPNCSVIPNVSQSVKSSNGGNCSHWDTTFTGAVADFSPDVVVMLFGGGSVLDSKWVTGWNNIGNKSYDSRLKASIETIGGQMAAQRIPVILCTVPYFGSGNSQTSPSQIATKSKVNQFNAIIRQVVSSNSTDYSLFNLNTLVSPSGAFTSTVNGSQVRSSDGILFSQPGGGSFVAPMLFSLAVPLGFNYRLSPYVPPIVVNKG